MAAAHPKDSFASAVHRVVEGRRRLFGLTAFDLYRCFPSGLVLSRNYSDFDGSFHVCWYPISAVDLSACSKLL